MNISNFTPFVAELEDRSHNPTGECLVTLNSPRGIVYTLHGENMEVVTFEKERAQKILDKIMAKGEIDLQYWDSYTPYGTIAWIEDGHGYQQLKEERGGLC